MAWTGSGGTRRPPATPGLPRRPARLTDAVLLERLRLLAPLASANRGSIPLGDPRRIGAVEFTWLLAQARRRGMPTRELADVTGMRWGTLDQRLRRHAMTATVPPSMSTYQGRQVQHALPTSCQRGHEFTAENTYEFTDSNGRRHRSCRRCRADLEARRRASANQRPAPPEPEGGGSRRVPAAAIHPGDRRRRDQRTRSESTVRGSATAMLARDAEPGTLSVAQVADLQERLTGVRPAPATLRSYLSRGQMPAQVRPGRWAETEIREWMRHRRIRRTTDRLAGVLDTIAAAAESEDQPAAARAVRAARTAGAHWQHIGDALGVSRQAAWKRYRTDAPA